MEISKEEQEINVLIDTLKYLKATIKRKNKISDRLRNFTHSNNTPRQYEKANVDLNWECMELDKIKTDFARFYEKSSIKVGIGEKNYSPSPFHNYKH